MIQISVSKKDPAENCVQRDYNNLQQDYCFFYTAYISFVYIWEICLLIFNNLLCKKVSLIKNIQLLVVSV